MRGRASIGATVAAVIVGTATLFAWFQEPYRRFETSATVDLLHTFGLGRLNVLFGNSILVFPPGHEPIRAVVTPSCSAFGSLLALAALGLLNTRSSMGRRAMAVAVALVLVQFGNLARIGASIAVGYLLGRPSLLLFHDWVGSAFAFIYTLGGFLIYLWFLLPASARPDAERPARSGVEGVAHA